MGQRTRRSRRTTTASWHDARIHGLDFGSGERAAAAGKEAFEQGLIIATCGPGGRVLKVMAPLTIEPETLDEGLAILSGAVDAAMA